jgi:RND superfamily putative drug exporter
MVAVFVSFVLGKDVFGKMFGIGLASAVLIDATVVRMVLVPVTMELLGDRNWWLPGWLDRMLPHVHAEALDVLEADIEPSVGAERTPPAPAGTGR